MYQTSRLHIAECIVQDLRESIKHIFECEKVTWERLNTKYNKWNIHIRHQDYIQKSFQFKFSENPSRIEQAIAIQKSDYSHGQPNAIPFISWEWLVEILFYQGWPKY